MNIYFASDDAIRKFDVNGALIWTYAPSTFAAAPTLFTGCAPRQSATLAIDISAEEEESLRPDWLKSNGLETQHPVQLPQGFEVGDH
eukprot:2231160-Pyramimonas_sp.AAC.1